MAMVSRVVLGLVLTLGCAGQVGWSQVGGGEAPAAQAGAPAPAAGDGVVKDTDRPIPDIPALMQEVAKRQRNEEAVLKNYLYHELQTAEESDGHGGVKKTETQEYDIFWVSGVPVRRMVKKNGKELSAEEQKKESDRIDKEVAKVREKRDKANADGKDTDSRGNEEITPSRFLELGSFTNARRVKLDGRDTIAVDYAGNPKAKTRNRAEDVVRDLEGTVWVDEQDRVLSRVEGHFVNAFKIGAGLVVNIQKDTRFSLQMKKVNNEVWLPEVMNGHGAMRIMLFFSFNGEGRIVDSDYRKFQTSVTILPGVTAVDSPVDSPQ
jgi:hypothetical protein